MENDLGFDFHHILLSIQINFRGYGKNNYVKHFSFELVYLFVLMFELLLSLFFN